HIFPCGTVITSSGVVPDPLVIASGIITEIFAQDVTVSGYLTVASGITVSGVSVITEIPDPLTLNEIHAVNSLTISGVPVSTGTGGGASTLQDAYDGGDGTITTVSGKPVTISGELAVTESLTISGSPVSTGTGGAGTLQEAYDGGDGTIVATEDKPVSITERLTVSGEICVDGYVEAKDRVTAGITCADGLELPYVYAQQDVEQTTIAGPYVSADCETPVLTSGHPYLLMYCSSVGSEDTNTQTWVDIVHGADILSE
ncbi:unnamed protein product, partial [marine sediment metagenome]